jgi:hypothetical protein
MSNDEYVLLRSSLRSDRIPSKLATCCGDQLLHLLTGLLLVSRQLNQHPPACVDNALGKAVIFHHSPDVQVLKGDQIIVVHQISADFVSSVFSLIGLQALPPPYM